MVPLVEEKELTFKREFVHSREVSIKQSACNTGQGGQKEQIVLCQINFALCFLCNLSQFGKTLMQLR